VSGNCRLDEGDKQRGLIFTHFLIHDTDYLFKYTLRERAKKIEEKSRLYAGLAHIMRRDGLWMISLVRFSILPGHITTCIQSTIGISVWIFGIACAISLPKQLAIVYLGVLFGESHKLPAEDSAEGTYSDGSSSDTTHKIVSWTVLCVTGFLTVVAMYVIWFRMWQEEKRIKGENQESGNMSSESKEELILDEGSMRYTLPYMYDPASAESIKRGRAPSYASTSTTAPTIHAQSGRPKMGRSRSSTLGSLAFSNNSLPYLPYTPMLDVHTGNFPIPARNLPSPVPSTVVTFPSATLQEEEDDIQVYGQDSYIEMRTVSPRSDASSSYMQLSSRASTPANSDLSVRARHLRLARSSSNMLLPSSAMHTSTSSTYSPTPSMMNEEIALMPRAASPVGRPRAGSRASSFVNTPTTVSLDSRSSSPGVVSVKDLAEEETILSTTVKAHPLAGSPLESPASPVDDVRQ
jgi:hypothetical protein